MRGRNMLGEFVLRIVMVPTLPVVFVLAISPIVFNVLIVGGIVVSALWARYIVRTNALSQLLG